MNRPFIETFLKSALFFLCLANHAVSETSYPQLSFASIRYRLIDLGECDVGVEKLSRNGSLPLTPKINDHGQVIGNRQEGGFFYDPKNGPWAPYIGQGIVIYFHALTNQGNILASINRASNAPEWVILTKEDFQSENRRRLNVDKELQTGNASFIGLSEDNAVFGTLKTNEFSHPFSCKVGGDPFFLEDKEGKRLFGSIKACNAKGQAVGNFQESYGMMPPAAWDPQKGAIFLKHFRPKISPNLSIELQDMVLTDDGTIYGTYGVLDLSKQNEPEIYAYAWQPFESRDLKLLDLDGMHIAAVNAEHVLAGEYKGEAALCEPGKSPVKLSFIVPSSQLEGWQLMEATSINRYGDIAGFGKLEGKMHLFKLEKLPLLLPPNQL